MTRHERRTSANRTPGGRQSLIDSAFLGLLAFATAGTIWSGCESSGNTVDPLEAEIAAAKRAKAKRSPAECTPGSQEPCYPGPEGSESRGVCAEGMRTCDPGGHWLECEKAVVPTKELCNGVDDDCNGQVDDGFQREGTQCWNGEGECKAEGTFQCSDNGKESTCSAPVIQPSTEICDGKDNDCDGQTDEGDTRGAGAECRSGKVGVCSTGHTTCVGAEMKCVQDKQPSIEICNKLDDDCDGTVDDNCVTAEEAASMGGG
jgi:hypothetical protein